MTSLERSACCLRARAVSIVLLVGLGCTGGDGDPEVMAGVECPERLIDTLGNEYGFDCDDPFIAVQLATTPTPPSCTESTFFSFLPTEHMLRVCYFEGESGTSGTTGDEQCRPIACDARHPCPSPVACRNGLCTFGEAALALDDVLALCLADVPWPMECSLDFLDPRFSERVSALSEGCLDETEACTLPADCRHP